MALKVMTKKIMIAELLFPAVKIYIDIPACITAIQQGDP